MASNPLAPDHLFAHVEDADYFHVPGILVPPAWHGHVPIPQPFQLETPLIAANTGDPLIDRTIQPLDLKITKFMVLEVVAAVLVAALFIGLARRIRGGERFWCVWKDC